MTIADATGYVALVISGIALLATVVILLIGFRISSDFAGYRKRIEELEDWKSGETRELDAIRGTTEIMTRLHWANYTLDVKLATMIVVILENASEESEGPSSEAFREFRSDLEADWTRAQRYLQYLQFAKEVDIERAELELSNIVGRYRDETTIEFLKIIDALMPDDIQVLVRNERGKLIRELRGIDSNLWTGRS